MWLKSITFSQLFVAFLLVHHNVMPTSAINMAQLKNQQPAVVQTSTTSARYQQHPNQITSQTQHKLQQQQLQQHQEQEKEQPQQPQQQPFQSADIAAHPANGISSSSHSVLLASSAETQASPSSSSTSTLTHLPSAQYVIHDKEIAMQEILKRFNTDTASNDPYQMSNELKRSTYDNTNHELPPPPPELLSTLPNNMAFPWNFYDRSYAPITLPPPQIAALFPHHFNAFDTAPTSYPVMPRFLPYMSYPPPVYVPYPYVMPPELYYSGYSNLPNFSNDYEDSMSRGAGSTRRPGSSHHISSHARNSPTYYVRLPPTPYMFLPSLGLGTTTPPMSSYPNILPYQSLSSFPSFSPIFNVPINFLANGKPSNIYQMSAPPSEMQNHVQFSNIPSSFNTRPPPPPPANAYRPEASSPNYFNTQHSSAAPPSSSNYGSYPGALAASAEATPTTSSSSYLSHQDSKLTALKRPYFFNGRPENIYILPNNFNPLYSSDSTYDYY